MDIKTLDVLKDFSKALPHDCPHDLCGECQKTGDIMRKHGFSRDDIDYVLEFGKYHKTK